MKLFFTIITCTYNSEKFIEVNLESVENQTYDNFEHLFVDGMSKDKTYILLKDYKKKSKHPVKIVRSAPKGISNAFNTGIKYSRGKNIYFLNSDDSFYDGNVLSDAAKFLDGSFYDFIFGKINVLKEDGKRMGVFPEIKLLQRTNPYLLKYINFIPHQGVFMKKRVFDKFGTFDETLKTNMDYELFLRTARRTSWVFFDRIVANYTVRTGAASTGTDSREKNKKSLEKIQALYLNGFERLIAKGSNFFLDKFNKIYR